jgi:hypothetical protein
MSQNDQTLPLDDAASIHATTAHGTTDDHTGAHTTSTDAAPASVPAVHLEPLHPRFGTIVWGCILLIVGGIAIFASRVDVSEATPAVIVWSVIGFGAALVLAAIVAAIVRAVRRPRGDAPR